MPTPQEIRARWDSLLADSPYDTFCNVAYQDISWLLDKMEAMQKVVDAADTWNESADGDSPVIAYTLTCAVCEYFEKYPRKQSRS
jgi:hypothetical protein